MNHKRISISGLFQLLCVVEMVALLWVFKCVEPSLYVNGSSIVLAEVLTIVNFLIISDSKKKDNPLLLVLGWWSLTFIVMRVISLNYTDYSVCLKRSSATVTDVNQTLVYIIVGIIVIWIALRGARTSKTKFVSVFYSEKCIRRSLILFWIAFALNLIADFGLPLAGLATIIKNFILNVGDLLYMLCIYLILVWDKITKRGKIWVVITFVAYLLFVTLFGSRSGIYSILKMLFFVCLALGYRHIKTIYVAAVALLVPFMLFLFVYSTNMRQMDMWDVPISQKITIVSDVVESSRDIDTKKLLAPVFDRVGFLDFAAEMYARKDVLRQFVNLKTELMSVIDNALSPGFDVFDAPRISNVISNSYEFNAHIISSKSMNSNQDYHSDELTIFGESILVFGVPLCFVFLFFAGYLLKKFWNRGDSKMTEQSFFLKSILLFLFEIFLSSYGMDWLALDIVGFFITYWIYRRYAFAELRKVKRTLVAIV